MSIHEINISHKHKSVTLKSYANANASELELNSSLNIENNLQSDLRVTLTKYFIAVVFLISIVGIFLVQ